MERRDSLLWLGLPAALVAGGVPAAAQVFATEAEALQAAFGDQVALTRQVKSLNAKERQNLEEKSGLHFSEASYAFVVATREEKVVGYALVMNEIGKSEPITFLVAMSPGGEVADVVVLVFRESRGAEVRKQRFVRQFRGKTVSDPLRVNQDVLNYTGATLSSKALARGVKRALLLLEQFYPAAERRRLPASGSRVQPSLPTAQLSHGESALYRQRRYLMGTVCELCLWVESPGRAARAFAAGFAELRRLDRVFSNYREDSELARVNREAAAGPVPVSAEFWDLTRYAVRSWRDSGGAFDCTAGPLLKVWGFWEQRPRVPVRAELEDARERVGSDKLELSAPQRSLRFRRAGMELDFGGLAKGYAAQRAAGVARGAGAAAALVSLGSSSLYALGQAPHRWVVAVADPQAPARPALFFELQDGWAVSTSGTYEQRLEAGGQTLSHLLDPRTGQPLAGLRSGTVVARSGRRSEVLSKRLLLASDKERTGLRKALKNNDWVLLERGDAASRKRHERWRHTSLFVPCA